MIASPRKPGSGAAVADAGPLTFPRGVTYHVDYRVAAILLIGSILVGASVFGVHRYQMRRIAELYLARADEALERGNLKDSIRLVAAYISLRPDDVNAQIRLAIAKSQAARTSFDASEALVALEDLVRRLPGRTEPRRELVNLLLAFGRENDALKNLEVLVEALPDDKNLVLLAGQIHRDAGNLDQAIATLQRLVESSPTTTEAYALLLDFLREREETNTQADELVTRLLEVNGNSAKALLICANDSRRRGALTESLNLARRATEVEPGNEEALILLSDLVWLLSQPGNQMPVSDDEMQRLSDKFAAMIAKEPTKSSSYLAIAQVEMVRHNSAAAREWLTTGLEQCAEPQALQFGLVETLIEMGEHREADELMTTLEENGSDLRALEFLRARSLISLGRWSAAAERLRLLREDVAERRELAFQVETSLALCFKQLHHSAWEIEALNRALRFDRWSYLPRLRLAQLLAERGEFDDAVFHCRFLEEEHDVALPLAEVLLQDSLRRPPEERSLSEVAELLDQADERAGAPSARSQSLRIRLLDAREQWSEATAMAASAQDQFPNDEALWQTRLGLLLHEKKFSEAVAFVEDRERRLGQSTATELGRIQLSLQAPAQSNQTAEMRLEPIARKATELPTEQRAEVVMALARAAESLQDERLAGRYWSEATKVIPDDVRPWRGMLDLTVGRGDDAQALKCIERLRELEGSEGVYWRFGIVQLAIQAAEKGDRSRIAEAEENLASVLVVFSTSPDVALLQARVADLRGQFGQSTEFLLDAYERGGHSLELAAEIVRRLVQRQRFSDAESFIVKHHLKTELAKSASLGKIAAEVALQLGDRESALERARAVVPPGAQNVDDMLWLARIYEQAEAEDQAGPLLEAACRLAPDDPGVWLARGNWLLRTRRESEARTLITSAVEGIPESQRPLLLAQWAEATQDSTEAERWYLDGLAMVPDDRALQLAAAAFFLKIGDVARSEPLWRGLLASNDRTVEGLTTIRRGLAACLLLKRAYPGLVEGLALLELNAEASENPGDRRIRARILASMPDAAHRREAIAELYRIEDSATLTVDDQMLLVQLFLNIGAWEDARRELVGLTIRRPDDIQILELALREFLSHHEGLEFPEDWFSRISELRPVDPVTRELGIRMVAASGETEEALDRLHRWADGSPASEFESTSTISPIEVAILAESLGDWFDRHNEPQKGRPFWNEAERVLRREGSRDDQSRVTLARFLIRRNKLDEAGSILESAGGQVSCAEFVAVAIQWAYSSGGGAEACRSARQMIDRRWSLSNETNAEVLFGVASLAQLEGDFVEAESLCRRVLASDSESIMACNDLAFLLAHQDGHQGEALELIDRALAKAGRIGWLVDTDATVLRRAGQTDQALTLMQGLVAEEATPARWFHLAQAYRDNERLPEARVALQRALAAGLVEAALHPLERAEFREMVKQFGPSTAESTQAEIPRTRAVRTAGTSVNCSGRKINPTGRTIANIRRQMSLS